MKNTSKNTAINTKHCYLIGVSGSIASGKSYATQYLAKKLEVNLIDCDAITHQLLQTTTIIQQVKTLFGSEVLNHLGSIDRKELAKQVFASPDKLKQLETMLHPLIAQEVSNWQEKTPQTSQNFVFIEGALLAQDFWFKKLSLLIWIEASTQTIKKRLKLRDPNRSEEQINQIIHRQQSLKNKVTQLVKKNPNSILMIENKASIEDFKKNLDHLAETIKLIAKSFHGFHNLH